MRFNLAVLDPPGYPYTHFLFDLLRLLQAGLESLGHPCTLSHNALEPGRVNVLVGLHNLQTADQVRELLATKERTVLLQTEMVTGATFNDVPIEDRRMAEVFLPVARRAVAVWDGSKDNQRALREHGIEAELLRFGYHPAIEDICHKTEKDIDFFFYGSVTAHRREVLAKLSALGYRVRVIFDAPVVFRNDLLSRAEVVLSMRQSEAMAHLPHGRILYLVNNRCLVVGESGREQEALEDVFLWSDPDDFVELCRETRSRADRRAVAEEHFERFRARPITEFLAPLVESLAARL